MDDTYEKAIKNKNNLTEIRSAIEEIPGLGEAVIGSIAPVVNLLNERFARMKLKENKVKVCSAASQDDILDNFECIHFIEADLDMHRLTQADLKKAPALQAFMDKHCHSSHYLFKKCGQDSCYYCLEHPVRLPQSEFERLNFIPLPLMNATKDHYKSYQDLYGQVPSEVDRPSKAPTVNSEAKAVDRENSKLLVAGKVRSVIHCGECNKPRCIYVTSRLDEEEKEHVEQCVHSRTYTCGSELFPSESQVHNTIICRRSLNCSDPMEAQYYSSTCVKFPPVCWFCGSPEEALCDEDCMQSMRKEYAIVRPICFLCRSDGKRPATWGPLNVAKRPRV